MEWQTIQLPNEKGQKDKHKQWSTKHYKEKLKFSNTDPTKNGKNYGALEGSVHPAPLVTQTYMMIVEIRIINVKENEK